MTPEQPGSTNPDISVDEVLQEMEPLGRALFDAALGRVRVQRLQARIDQLERQGGATGGGPDVPHDH